MKTITAVWLWLVSLVTPFLLLMAAIQILFNPWFLSLEYNRTGFPADGYGFTTSERLKFGNLSLEYMRNKEGIEWLGAIQMADGNPLYNERELSHMLDVKILLNQAVSIWMICLGLVLFTGVTAWRAGKIQKFWKALSRGGWITIGIILAVLIYVAISFSQLFTWFHKIFFTGDTWLFLYTDSLIRLFPMQLWQDAFIWMGSIALAGALILALLVGKLAKKNQEPR